MAQSRYLLEIGTEELPVSFLGTARRELENNLAEALGKSRLSFEDITLWQTPRRMTVVINGLTSAQSPADELLKGPPVSVGLDGDGKHTPAAIGFAKKNGILPTDLTRQTIDGSDYLVFSKHDPGRPAKEVLPEILPDLVLNLSGSHFMAWDKSAIRFSRPIRWLVSLLDGEHVPVQIGLCQSSRASYGHRFFAQSSLVEIDHVENYTQSMQVKGGVVVDHNQRRELIWEGLQTKAQSLGGVVPPNEDFLDTVTMLVESPCLIAGGFDPAYLKLPKAVITTVMAAHQKYFPVESASGELMPYFITISNNPSPKAEPTIKAGNEKVLKARLEDAAFFYQEDTKHPLAHYGGLLEGIMFQKGLGSLADKTRRLMSLTDKIAAGLSLSASDTQHTRRAAELCKADLATQMVRELTELQGVVGQYYARSSGEDEAVANAIEAHYHPRFLGDSVAQSPAGIALALADKLDTLVAVFAQKDARHPTGSKDPMGLRRMSFGVIQTVLENQLAFNLEDALGWAYDSLGELAKEPREKVLDLTRQFILQRLKGYLLEQQYAFDTIDAVLEGDTPPLSSLTDTIARLKTVKTLQQNDTRLKALYEPANRISRILGQAYDPAVTPASVKAAHFQDDSEKVLFESVSASWSTLQTAPITDLPELLQSWTAPVEAFFDKVLVNADDPAVKANRYVLLSLLNAGYRKLADLSKLVV